MASTRWACLLFLLLSTPAMALEKVVLQLKWTHAFQFAGYYAAKELGYYRDAGLDVDIRDAARGEDVVSTVVAGGAQFGVGTSSLLLARHAGQPVVALAVVFQHSPLVLIAAKTRAQQGIHDLADKTLMLEPQSDELIAYLKQERVPIERVRVRPHSHSVADLTSGRVDAMSAYSTVEPYDLDHAGVAYQMYTPRSAGIDFYGDNLFTTEQEIKSNPDRVEAFREASLRGWSYAMAHPDEVGGLIHAKYAPGLSLDFLRFEAARMTDLMRTDLIAVGYMNPGRWRHIADTYAELGLLPADFSLDGFLYTANHEFELKALRKYLVFAFVVILFGATIGGYSLYSNHRLARSLTQLARTQAELGKSEARYRTLTENMKDVVWCLDVETMRFTYVSPSVEELRGFTAEEVMSEPMDAAMTPESRKLVHALIAERSAQFRSGAMLPKTFFTNEVEQARKDGTAVWTEVITHYVFNPESGHVEIHGVTRDITERKAHDERIRHLAQHDTLTGLANRALFSDRMQQAVAVSRRDGCGFALLYIDLDGFKPVNDKLGHAVGDALLQAVAKRIKEAVRESDSVARIGGDEFLVLLRALGDGDGAVAVAVAEKIRGQLNRPFDVDGHALEISCSIGVAMYPEHGEDEIELSLHADHAMYQAKRDGRNKVRLFRPEEERTDGAG